MRQDHSILKPFLVVPPGSILKREIKARGWTQAEFARIIGRSTQNVNELIHSKRQITIETALLLQAALDIAAEFWLKLEGDYRLRLAASIGDLELVRQRAREAS